MLTLLPLLGIVLGATLQYWFSQAAERRRRQQRLRSEVYVNFLRGAAGVAMAQKFRNKEKEEEFMFLLVDARTRIAVYGNREVILRINDFWRLGGVADSPEQKKAFVAACQAMRKESLPPSEEIPDKEMARLLFDEDVE